MNMTAERTQSCPSSFASSLPILAILAAEAKFLIFVDVGLQIPVI